MKNILTLLLLSVCPAVFAQEDQNHSGHTHRHDSSYIVHENIPKNKFWGNSWYSGLSYTLSQKHEFGVNIGRTYGVFFSSGGGFNVRTISWGLGYSHYQRRSVQGQMFSAFGEFSNFFLPPATARMEYLTDHAAGTHYLRPSVGLSFFAFDVLYSYAFRLAGGPNELKHGLTIRFKYYINNKNWEKVHPGSC